jgi:spore coat polysaccharide biosynthesis protein SpsF
MLIGAIIQARVSSSRLPGKVLFNLPANGNKKMIDQIISRCKAAKKISTIVLATSTHHSDEELVNHVVYTDLVYTGSLTNVLNRYYECATIYKMDHIVRITGDNPCIDPVFIDKAIDFHLENDNDYTYTQGLPIGLNIEILSYKALKIANNNAKQEVEKEHVTPYIKGNESLFKNRILIFAGFEHISDLRLTVDYANDFSMINLLYNYLGDEFSINNVMDLITKFPWLKSVNVNLQKQIYKSQHEELEVAIKELEKLELNKSSDILKKYLIEK